MVSDTSATVPDEPATVSDPPATVSGVNLWDILQLASVLSPEASGRQRVVMYVRLAGADCQRQLGWLPKGFDWTQLLLT